jgi:dolichol kinase
MPYPQRGVRAGPNVRHDISYTAELHRKALHLLALVVPIGMAVVGKTWSIYLLVPVGVIALTADILRVKSPYFARMIYLVFGFMMRRDERPPVGGPVAVNGATWVLLSAALLAVVFPIRVAAAAFTMFMVADAAAALVGRRFGKTRWRNSSRTFEGSVAFALAGLIMMGVLPWVAFWVGAVAVAFATVAEIPNGPANDNIRVPFVAATVIFLIERFVLGVDLRLFI